MKLELILATTLAGGLAIAGCESGQNPAHANGNGPTAAATDDPALKKAQELVEEKNYAAALQLLRSYKSSDVSEIETQTYLLGTALLNGELGRVREAAKKGDWSGFPKPDKFPYGDDDVAGAYLEKVAREVDATIALLPAEKQVQIYVDAGWLVHKGKTVSGFRSFDSDLGRASTFYSSLMDEDFGAFNDLRPISDDKYKELVNHFPDRFLGKSKNTLQKERFEGELEDFDLTHEVVFIDVNPEGLIGEINKVKFPEGYRKKGSRWVFGKVSFPAQAVDVIASSPTLKKAREFLDAKNYRAVVQLLRSYQSSDATETETQTGLLATALVGEEVERVREAARSGNWSGFPPPDSPECRDYLKRFGVEKFDEEIYQVILSQPPRKKLPFYTGTAGESLKKIAIKVDRMIAPLPAEKRLQIYADAGWIVHKGKTVSRFRRTDTPESALLTYYSSLKDKDFRAFNKVMPLSPSLSNERAHSPGIVRAQRREFKDNLRIFGSTLEVVLIDNFGGIGYLRKRKSPEGGYWEHGSAFYDRPKGVLSSK